MKTISYTFGSNINVDELRKLISFISPDVLSYDIKDSNLILSVEDTANEKTIISNANLITQNYLSAIEKEEMVFAQKPELQFIAPEKILESELIHTFNSGLIGLNKQAIFLFRYFDYIFKSIALSLNATEKMYPVLLPMKGYEKTGYLKTSPQYSIFCCCPNEEISELMQLSDSIDMKRLTDPQEALSPAACFHTYLEYTDKQLPEPILITFIQNVFRNEGRFNWSDFGRLKDYHVREIVFIGSTDYVVDMREKILSRTIEILKELGIYSSISIATDPFIVPKMQKFKKLQLQDATKFELRLSYSKDQQISCASFNLHGTAFSHPFNISVNGIDETVTGCVGFGIERWVLAFLCQFGIEPDKWPLKIREAFDNEKCC